MILPQILPLMIAQTQIVALLRSRQLSPAHLLHANGVGYLLSQLSILKGLPMCIPIVTAVKITRAHPFPISAARCNHRNAWRKN